MNKERLLKLAAFLRELPLEKFDINQVVTSWDFENDCGFVCCAIGWTPQIFPELVAWTGGVGWSSFPLKCCITNEERSYVNIASSLFDIDSEQVTDLFEGSNYDSNDPNMVADRIESFIKKYE